MKWALFALACVSLLMCYRVGAMAARIKVSTPYMMEDESAIHAAAASTYSAGAVGAGLIGAASIMGAAWIQVSENKKRD